MLLDPHVQVHDDLLPDALKARLLETMPWMPVHFLNRRDRFRDAHPLDIHWYYPFAFTDDADHADVEPQFAALDEPLRCVADCWRLIKARWPGGLRLYECMLSANAFGTEGSVHHDIDRPDARPRHLTVLVYCNPRWDIGWGGETLVFDERQEVSAAVMPRPGRVMTLCGDPAHVGRSVSRTCPTDRRVLVFKAWQLAPGDANA